MSTNKYNPGGIMGSRSTLKISKKARDGVLDFIKNEEAKLSKKEIFNKRLQSLKLSMQRYLDSSDEHIPIGVFIKYLIDSLGITNSEFAKLINIQKSNLSAIMNEKRPLTEKLSFILGYISKTSSFLWMEVYQKNNLHKMAVELKIKEKDFFDKLTPDFATILKHFQKGIVPSH